jgi:hypothetical protein
MFSIEKISKKDSFDINWESVIINRNLNVFIEQLFPKLEEISFSNNRQFKEFTDKYFQQIKRIKMYFTYRYFNYKYDSDGSYDYDPECDVENVLKYHALKI